MDAQTELQNVSSRNSSLSTLSNVLYAIGVIAIIAGVITFFVGVGYADSWDDTKRLVSSSYITIGIGSVISGFCFFFFGAIGKAVNEMRNHAIADFNLRYNLSQPIVDSCQTKVSTEHTHVETIGNVPVMTEPEAQSQEHPQETKSNNDLEIGDKVKLISNGAIYVVVGLAGNDFVQCKPIKKDFIEKIFDNYTSFKRSALEKVEE